MTLVYMGKDDAESYIVRIESAALMNRLYMWNQIKLGTMDGFNRIWPWEPTFRMSRWIQPDFKEWLEKHATDEEGMPQYSIRWREVQVENYFRKYLHIHFYRERSAAIFRLTYG